MKLLNYSSSQMRIVDSSLEKLEKIVAETGFKQLSNLLDGHVKRKDFLELLEEIKKVKQLGLNYPGMLDALESSIEHYIIKRKGNIDTYYMSSSGDIWLLEPDKMFAIKMIKVEPLHNFEYDKDKFDELIAYAREKGFDFYVELGLFPKVDPEQMYKKYWLHDFDDTVVLNKTFPPNIIKSLMGKIVEDLYNPEFSEENKYIIYMIYKKYTPSDEIMQGLRAEIEKHISPENLKKLKVVMYANRYKNYDHKMFEEYGYYFEIRDDLIIEW